MDNREADSASHPPACTCKDCVARRLGKVRERGRFRSSSKISQTRDTSSDKIVPPNKYFVKLEEYKRKPLEILVEKQ